MSQLGQEESNQQPSASHGRPLKGEGDRLPTEYRADELICRIKMFKLTDSV